MGVIPGTRLGPYEIVSLLGAGGMGEVYRAKDPRLGREVAIKVLPASFSQDTDRLRRFEQEAKTAGSLNHPNITAVYDIGTHEGAPYVVQELLEGETLRAELAGGRLSPRKATEYAVQITRGLAAAHERGIVHRDVKPENLFVTKDGRIKILDFGLAKLVQREQRDSSPSELPTQSAGTEPGVVLGTLGYMSPEQVRGKASDARSDIFSFGAVLYEMLSGKRAFQGDSAADTMSAILTKEPPDLSQAGGDVSASLDRVVRHCLEKSPEQRFQSARDLAFALESASVGSGSGLTAAPQAPRRVSVLAILLALAVAAIPAAVILTRRSVRYQAPSFQQLTFRRGTVLRARYTPDGGSIIYSAAWEGAPTEIFTARLDGTESRPFGIKNADVLAVSSKGEVAVLLKKSRLRVWSGRGTLAVVPLAGGAQRELLENVSGADWSPDGTQLAVSRLENDETLLEYPTGRVLYKTKNNLFGLSIRVSGSGKQVAFAEFTPRGSDLRIVDSARKATTLLHVDQRGAIFGLHWRPGDREILFCSRLGGSTSDIDLVDMSGHVRTLYRGTNFFVVQDSLADGRLLITQARIPVDLMFGSSKEPSERNLGWLTRSWLADMSEDGGIVLFHDLTDIYLRRTDGSPAVRLGAGRDGSLSPDGRWVLASSQSEHELLMIPTGPGQVRKISIGELVLHGSGFTPDGKSILFRANAKDGQERLYVTDETGKAPRAVSEAGQPRSWAVSPDGKEIALSDAASGLKIYPLDGGATRTIAGFDPDDNILAWSAVGGFLYVTPEGDVPAHIGRFDLATGRKELWKTLVPPDEASAYAIVGLHVTRDGKFWAYTVLRNNFSELWQVTGLAKR
jgi:eukaryotic-like serine/threonine-protein kinase